MKQWLRLSLTAILVLCFGVALFGCRSVEGLQENGEWKEDPSGVSRNKEIAHTDLLSFDTLEEALKNDRENSPYRISLNGTWKFDLVNLESDIPESFQAAAFDDAAWSDIKVPGNWEVQGFSTPVYTYAQYAWNTNLYTPPAVPERTNEIGLYRRTVDIPADWSEREVYISLEGVESACYVYVNGLMVGYGEDTYTTKDFRITSYLNPGETNTVAVKVFKYSDGSWLEAQDGLKLGGIFRDISLYSAPKTEIKDVKFTYKFTEDFGSALLYTTVDIGAYGEAGSGEYVEVALYDKNGNEFLAPTRVGGTVQYGEEKNGGAFRSSVNNKISVTGMKLWSAETPDLYTAVVTLYNADGGVLDMVSTRIGFRDMAFDVDETGNMVLSVNGNPVNLFGVNYNEHSAVNGKAITREEMIADIELLKSLNVNAVRSAGVPFSTEFISLCDEYGLYVISELNIETEPWTTQGTQSLPGDQAIWEASVLDRLNNVLKRDKNNASVVMWSLGNQSGLGSNMSVIRNWLISNDARLVVYNAYYSEDIYGNISFETVGDIISTSGWDLGKLNEIVSDPEITAPIFVTDLDLGLLDGGGEISYYANLLDRSPKVQGLFLSFFKDRSLYMPKSAANAVDTVKNKPYNASNASLYELQYPVSWGKTGTGKEVIMALSGLVGGDGTVQTEAYELKNAYAAISVKPSNLAKGVFTVTNRNIVTAFENNYTIRYEVVKNGSTVVKNGTVSGLTLKPGETKNVTLDYGTLAGADDYFVTVTVSYVNAPSWAPAGYDSVISRVQYDLSGNTKPVKNGTAATVTGAAFTVKEKAVPTVNATDTGIAAGRIYVTNPGHNRLADYCTMTYTILEKNGYWNDPRWYVYETGTIDLSSVAAGAKYQEIRTGYTLKGTDRSSFRVLITVHLADAEYTYEFSGATFGLAELPVPVDEARIPTPYWEKDENGADIVDRKGEKKQAKDEEGHLLWVGGPFDDESKLYTEPGKDEETVIPEPSLELSNGKVSVTFDPKSGLILSYRVDGKEFFSADAEPSMLLSLMRTPTGGDYLSEVTKNGNTDAISYASRAEGKILKDNIRLDKIADDHYRMTLSYYIVSRDASQVMVENEASDYTVVYDFFGDGTVAVNVTVDLADATGIPTEIANLLTLDGSFEAVSWYGRGKNATYPDKKYDSLVGVYTGNAADLTGDRSEVRYAAFRDASGDGLLITSDDNLFAFNVSKAYPWETFGYASEASLRDYNVVSVIGVQRGVSAGSVLDEPYRGESTAIDAGGTYSYSFRIVPLKGSDDAAALAAQTVSGTGKADTKQPSVVNGTSFAFENKGFRDMFLTVGSGEVRLAAATGNANQIFKRLFTNITTATGDKTYSYQNLKTQLWLTPSETDAKAANIVEIGLAERDSSLKWQSWYQNGTELTSVGTSYVLSVYDKTMLGGARLTAIKSAKEEYTAFSVIVDPTNQNNVMMMSTLNDLYLTAVDRVTYVNPMIEAADQRRINYPLATDWSVYHESFTYDYSKWTKLLGRVTLTELLPGTSQEWSLVSLGNGSYRIVSKADGMVLGIEKSTDYATGNDTLNVIVADPSGDVSDLAVEWTVTETNGSYRIGNVRYGLVLQSGIERTFMTKTERDFESIVNVDDAVKLVPTLTVGEWNGTACQKWDITTGTDREVNLIIGEKWLDEVDNKS